MIKTAGTVGMKVLQYTVDPDRRSSGFQKWAKGVHEVSLTCDPIHGVIEYPSLEINELVDRRPYVIKAFTDFIGIKTDVKLQLQIRHQSIEPNSPEALLHAISDHCMH